MKYLAANDLRRSGTATGCSIGSPTGAGARWRVTVSGCGQGTLVLTGLTNRPEALQVQHAIQELGAVQVPLVPGMTFSELSYPIRHIEIQMLELQSLEIDW